jgi:hypothetical protein
MVAEFCVAPGNGNSLELGPNHDFTYGLPWGVDEPWSDDAVLRIVSDDGNQTHDFQKTDGEAIDDFVVFTFAESRPGVLYRGTIVDGDVEFELFGPLELWRLQDPADPSSDLPLPDVPYYSDDDGPDPEDADSSSSDGSDDSSSEESSDPSSDAT